MFKIQIKTHNIEMLPAPKPEIKKLHLYMWQCFCVIIIVNLDVPSNMTFYPLSPQSRWSTP